MFELIVAMVFEAIRSEPPEKIHPTVWFGKIAEFLDKKLPEGVFYGISVPFSAVIAAIILAEIPGLLPYPASILLSGFLLYTTVSIKSMLEHAQACIKDGKIDPDGLKRIVSRDLSSLKEWQMNSAVIESIAENFVDGVLAPLLYYSIFGLHGALIYRAVNTCDAMIGYRKGRYEKFGKASARLDDVINFIPSRISLFYYLILSRRAFVCGVRLNPKLNGSSVSAMAGLLGIKLEKPGYYRIDCGKEPEMNDVKKAMSYFKVLSGMAVLSALLLRMLV